MGYTGYKGIEIELLKILLDRSFAISNFSPPFLLSRRSPQLAFVIVMAYLVNHGPLALLPHRE